MRPANADPRRRLLLLALLGTIAAVTIGTAATVVAATDPGRRATVDGEGAAAPERFAEWLEASRRARTLRARIDSAVAPLGRTEALDSAEVRRVVAVLQQAPRAGSPTHAAGGLAWIAAPAALDDSTDLALLRRWARGAPLPTLWGLRTDLDDVPTLHHLPIRSAGRLRWFWTARSEAIASALTRGEHDAARESALELLAASGHFLDQPYPIDVLFGRVLARQGLKELMLVTQQAGDSAAFAGAGSLLADVDAMRVLPQGGMSRLGSLGADASDARLGALAADRSLHPATRLVAVERALAGACLSPREMLLGAGAERRALVARLHAAMGDLDRMGDLAPVSMRTLDAFDDPRALLATMDAWPATDAAPWWSRLIPPVVRSRARWCAALL
jgi:hypothetical protein